MSSDSTKTAMTRTTAHSGTTVQIQQLFKLMIENGASDLHISIGSAPAMRVSGEIVKVKIPALSMEDTKKLIYQILTESQKSELEKNLEIDFSIGVKGLGRFRVNCFHAKGGISGVFRQIPTQVPDFDSLGLPKVLMEMTNVSNGLMLVTGPTGSGKSTTLASIVDRINSTEPSHIITLEDPIEFVHQHKLSIVNQREIGTDTHDFHIGLRSLLRQDPDVVLIGELRDTKTIETALEIAETGHLVFGTLHTNSTIQTISRIINVFPSDKQDPIRTLLSFVLQGVVAQQLVPKKGGGRVLVQEILRVTPAIRNLIREDKLHQVYSQMQMNQEETKMVTMNQSLKKALDAGTIEDDVALTFSNNPDELKKMLGINKDS